MEGPCEWSWDLNPCSQILASMMTYIPRNATSISCVCFVLFNFNSHGSSCTRGVSYNWAVYAVWWAVVMGAPAAEEHPSHRKGCQWWTHKNHRGRRSFERLSNLSKVTELMNGKGGTSNSHHQNHLMSALICMNPVQAALPSCTPSSACHGITDQHIFFFVLFWF